VVVGDRICIAKFAVVLFEAFLFQTKSVSVFPIILWNQMCTKRRIQDEARTGP